VQSGTPLGPHQVNVVFFDNTGADTLLEFKVVQPSRQNTAVEKAKVFESGGGRFQRPMTLIGSLICDKEIN
jgi:hypothetical protein